MSTRWDRPPGVEITVKFPSATDPEVALHSKGDGEPARLCSIDQALMEKRSGLAANGSITEASDTAEGEARLLTVRRRTDRRRITFSADKARNMRQFNEDLRERTLAPHVAIDKYLWTIGKPRAIAIDRRTTRLPGYVVSLCCRKASRSGSAGSPFRRSRPH